MIFLRGLVTLVLLFASMLLWAQAGPGGPPGGGSGGPPSGGGTGGSTPGEGTLSVHESPKVEDAVTIAFDTNEKVHKIIWTDKNGFYTLRIMDPSGKVIRNFNKIYKEKNFVINPQVLAPGMSLLLLVTDKGTIITKKILKTQCYE